MIPTALPQKLAMLRISVSRDAGSVVFVRHPSCEEPLAVLCQLVDPMPGGGDPTPPHYIPLALILTPAALRLIRTSVIPTNLHAHLSLEPPSPVPDR